MCHKTLRKHGAAVVCLPQDKFQFLQIYVNKVRSKIPTDEFVFVTWNGNSINSGGVSRQINSIWQRSGVYGDNPPPKKNLTTTVIRKSVTTLVHDQEEAQAQPVADLLAHSLQTAKNVYRTRNHEKQAIVGSAVISKVFSGNQIVDSTELDVKTPQSPTLRLRTPWTNEELEIKDVFADAIANRKITMEEVRENMTKLRTCQKYPKQICDKIRASFRYNLFAEALVPPVEEETLLEKMCRFDEVGNHKTVNVEDVEGKDETINVKFAIVEAAVKEEVVGDDDVGSIISSSLSRLTGLQKLFDTNESEEIKTVCHQIAQFGSISQTRISHALSKTERGNAILENFTMRQIQTRIKYERRQMRQERR